MTQYNTLNVKLSNSQLNKLKSGTKNGTEVTLKRLGLTAAASATHAAIDKKMFVCIRYNYTDNVKGRSEWYENS